MNLTSAIGPAKTQTTGGLSPLIWVIGILLVTCMLFMWIQNSTNALGGHISFAKSLWLDYTLTMFFMIPFYFWRNKELSRTVRFLFGWILLSFVIRGIIEMMIIYGTHAWRCIYGISHDYLTLGLTIFLFLQLSRNLSVVDKHALCFLPIYGATLIFESINAWQFSLLVNPAAGIYFADCTPYFAFVNSLTWAELSCLWPWLFYFLWKTRFDFLRS